MDGNLVKINLYGDLGKHVGKHWELNVNSVPQAFNAIEILSKRKFAMYLYEKNVTGVRYKIIINGKVAKYSDGNNPESIVNSDIFLKRKIKTIDVIPVIEGAGDVLDIFVTVLGIALIATGIFAGFGAALKATLIAAGIGLAAAGVSSMLTKPPKFEPFQEFENGGRPSYLFAGPQNTVGEGGPVPLVYGEVITGSQTIAANYKIEYSASSSSSTVSNLNGDLDPDFGKPILYELTGKTNQTSVAYNPIIDFDFHPEDDELIVPYAFGIQDTAVSNLVIGRMEIVKLRDIPKTLSNKSNSTTLFYEKNSTWGLTDDLSTGNRLKNYRPVLVQNSSGNQTTMVTCIKSDRKNKQVLIGGRFKNTYWNDKFTLYNSPYRPIENLICLYGNGDLDGQISQSFSHPQPNNTVDAIEIINGDGSIIIGGEFTQLEGSSKNYLAKLTSGGAVTSFSYTPSAPIKALKYVKHGGTEYIFVGGESGIFGKYNTSGGAITAFNNNIPTEFTSAAGTIWSIEYFNGFIVVGGEFSFTISYDDGDITYENLCRFNLQDGTLDKDFYFEFEALSHDDESFKPISKDISSTAFNSRGYPRSTATKSVRSLSAKADQSRLVIGGLFSKVNAEEIINTKNLFALNPDGSIDKKFNPRPPYSGPDGHLQKVKYRDDLENSDNKIFVSGRFTYINSEQYSQEEIDIINSRAAYSASDRTIVNIARLYG